MGRIKNIKTSKILKNRKHNNGYYRVHFWNYETKKRKYYLIHRLVAEAFLPNPENKSTVNHINEIKTDNKVSNLEWATMDEQNHHGTRMERIDYNTRNKNPNYIARTERSYVPVNQIDSDGNIISNYCSIAEAARKINGSGSCIVRCCQNSNKTHKGFKWQYAK